MKVQGAHSESFKGSKNSPQIFTFSVNPSNNKRLGGYIPFEFCSAYSNNEHSNFLYIYFWFAYHLAFAPFRFKKLNEGKYEIYTWVPQQILCGIGHTLSLIKLATTLRSSVENIRTNDPISFFLMFCESSSFVFKFTIFKGFWRKRATYLKLIKYLTSYHLLPYNPHKIESIPAISLFCGSYAFLSFLRMVLGSGFLSIWDWSPSWWWRRLVGEARYTFFIANATSSSVAPALAEITSVDTVLAIIQGLIIQFRFITGFFVDLCILMHVLSLWAPTSGFTSIIYSQISIINSRDELPFDLGSSTKVELESVLRQFEALRNSSVLVGEAIGDIILPFIGEALFYYAIYFDDVILTTDFVTRLVLMFFYCSAVCILVFSAEIVRKMRWLKSWISENGRLALISQNQLTMVLDDLTNHSVGITASGIFTINYSFVGTIVSILITYFIIRLQSVQSLI